MAVYTWTTRDGIYLLRIDHKRSMYIHRKTSGWCVRLVEDGRTVKNSWPYEVHSYARAAAERMAVSLGWAEEADFRR